jgi:hypothetical protein
MWMIHRLSQQWLSAAGVRLEDRDPFAELQVGIEFSSFFRIENFFAVFVEQLFQAFLRWRRNLEGDDLLGRGAVGEKFGDLPINWR